MSAQAARSALSEFVREVCEGLGRAGQKELPCQYFYDDVGMALYETITVLDEYGPTRADARLLRKHAGDIIRRVASPLVIAELGSGTGTKTRWILEALRQREHPVYFPIDTSPAALARCARELEHVSPVVTLRRTYLDGLRFAARSRRPGQALLVLFLGSTIGNFERSAAQEFLGRVRECLESGDALLLGTDLVQEVPRMLLAYDDPAGVTAAFNRNLLARVNRELDADFDVASFVHEARWDAAHRRVEMHLRAARAQTVTLRAPGAAFEIAKDETIRTEMCHKFDAAEVREMGVRAGFRCDAQWIDPEWPFAETLFLAA